MQQGSKHEEQINCWFCDKPIAKSQIGNHIRQSKSCQTMQQIIISKPYDILGR